MDSINNPKLLDIWSITHVMHGIVLFSLIKHYYPKGKDSVIVLIAFLLHGIYELKDYYVSNVSKVNIEFGSSSPLNGIGDQMLALFGSFIPIAFPQLTKYPFLLLALDTILVLSLGIWSIYNICDVRGYNLGSIIKFAIQYALMIPIREPIKCRS